MSPTPSKSPGLKSTVAFGADGETYEIDLSNANAARLRDALAEYVASARTEQVGHSGTSARELSRPQEEWLKEVGERLDDGLHRAVQHDPAIAHTDPAVLADRLVAAVPTRHDLDTLTGPFYDTSGLTKWLSISRQALDARARNHTLLMCPLADGTRVYPVWQFRRDGSTVPHLAEALRILLPAARSPWTVATWLRTRLSEFENDDAVTWLDGGRDPEPVLAAAREDAERWTH